MESCGVFVDKGYKTNLKHTPEIRVTKVIQMICRFHYFMSKIREHVCEGVLFIAIFLYFFTDAKPIHQCVL